MTTILCSHKCYEVKATFKTEFVKQNICYNDFMRNWMGWEGQCFQTAQGEKLENEFSAFKQLYDQKT